MLDTEITRLKFERLAHIEERVEHQLLRHDAQLSARFQRLLSNIDTMHQHLP